MTRYADPSRCPDCGAAISASDPACPVCALSLRGDTALRLFETLSRADALLTSLRAASVPVPAAPAASPAPAAGDTTAHPAPQPRPRRRGLSAASVPQVLLGLGALCLLVAALVFLAVAWSVLGVGGRTATLVLLTAVAAGVAGWLVRRGLRGAAEALALVGYGLLALDVVGADHAGWFGDLPSSGLLVVLGMVLTLTGAAGALVVRRMPGAALTSGQVVAALGAALATLGVGASEGVPVSVALVAGTVLAALVTWGADRVQLRVTAVAAGVVATASWLYFVAVALDELGQHTSWAGLWGGLHVWPTLAAAALAAAPAALTRLPQPVRTTAAGLGGLLVTVAVTAPAFDLAATPVALVGIVVLLVAGAVCLALPLRWRLSTLPTQLVAGAGLLLLVLVLSVSAGGRLRDAAGLAWSGSLDDHLDAVPNGTAAPWLLPLATFALLATLAVLAEASARLDRAVSAIPGLQVVVLSLLLAACVGALALYPVALWLVVGVLLLAATAFTTWSVTARLLEPLGAAGAFLVLAVVVSFASPALTAAALAVAVGITAAVHLRGRPGLLVAPAGALLAAAVAAEAWTVGHLLDVAPAVASLAGLLLLGALADLAPYAPRRWWSTAEPVAARTGLEVGALAAAVPLTLAGLALAPVDDVATWLAVDLTVAGAATTLMSLLRPDRRQVGWLGGALLAAATWVRLWDAGVTAPEAYTLPSALALLVVGLLRLHRDPETGTMTALAPGLTLALTPSLLWVLGDPTGPRALLLGLACAALLFAGVRLRWTAPVVIAAAVGTVLVLRLAAPYIGDAVPRWVLLGAAGTLLVATGATWERRLQEARHLAGLVRALR